MIQCGWLPILAVTEGKFAMVRGRRWVPCWEQNDLASALVWVEELIMKLGAVEATEARARAAIREKVEII